MNLAFLNCNAVMLSCNVVIGQTGQKSRKVGQEQNYRTTILYTYMYHVLYIHTYILLFIGIRVGTNLPYSSLLWYAGRLLIGKIIMQW